MNITGDLKGVDMAEEMNFEPVEDMSGEDKIRPDWGISLMGSSSNESNRFGMLPMQGVRIAHVKSKGLAHAAGVRDGDILLAIDGVTVEDLAESSKDLLRTICDYLGRRRPRGSLVSLLVRRLDKDMIVMVHVI